MTSVTKDPHPATPRAFATPAPMASVSPSSTSRPNAAAGLSSLADAGLKASPSLKQNTTLRAFAAPALTGAAAMADEQRAAARKSPGITPNPAFTAVSAMMRDANQGISKPADALAPPQTAQSSSSLPSQPASTSITAEPMQIDAPMQSPTAMSSSDAVSSRNGHVSATGPDALPGDSPVEERSNKAFTYPPRPDQIDARRESSRQMSLPNANSTKSPSTKKHKCPHCETEFTRHHNLKSHLLTHSQEKPFACSSCNQKFRRLHDLKRHAKLHTGERPHVCEKCNRKFARGDALARHSKGPGGCAGRRGSVGEDDDGDGDPSSFIDPAMDGLTYDQDGDIQQGDPKRRKSAPVHDRKRSLQVANSSSLSSRQGSSYPPVAPTGRQDQQPDAAFHNHTHLSPRMAPGSSHPGLSFSAAPTSAYSQGGMTDSPAPLSPGTAESRRLSAGLPPPRPRSPSLSTSFAQQHITRGSSHGHASPPITLPPAQMPHAPQLPSISGLGSDSRAKHGYPSPTSGTFGSKTARPPPIISTHPPPGTNGPSSATSTQTGSMSSHHRSSGGSMREVLNPTGPTLSAGEDWFRDYVRSSEAEKQSLRDDFSAKTAEYETLIAELRAEIAGLRGQRPSALPPPPAR